MTMSLLLEHFDGLLVTPENAEQLNRVILQLAVQGKLVEQDPNDEPAKEFLDKAFKKKNSNGSLIEHQPVQEEEKLFQVPESWEWVRLLEICTLRTGKKDVNQGSPKGKYPFFTCANKPLWSDEYSFEGPSLILPGNGANVGMAWLFDGKFEAYQRTYVLNNFLVNEKYIHHVFMVLWEDHVKGKQSGSAINYIKLGNFEKFVLPIPPLAEQKRIVARVEELFAQTRALAKELAHSQIELDGLNQSALSHLLASETAEEFNQYWTFIAEHFDLLFQSPEHVAPLRQSILELAVRGKLTRREAGDESAKELLKRIKDEKVGIGKEKLSIPIKDDERPVELPQGWEWVKLNEIILGIEAGHSFLAEGRPAQDHEFGVLKVSAVTWGEFDPQENKALLPGTSFRNDFLVRAYDMLITRANTAELVGAVVLVDKDYPNLLLSDKTLRLNCASEVFKPYLLLALRAPWVREAFGDQAIGTSSSMRNISQDKIRSALIAFPPLAEQERIVKRVEQLLSLCDALEVHLQSAEEERGRLVAAVMAGVGGSDGE